MYWVCPLESLWISSTNSEKWASFSCQYWHHERCGGASVWGFVGYVRPIFDYERSTAIKEMSSFTISLSLTLRLDYSQTSNQGEKPVQNKNKWYKASLELFRVEIRAITIGSPGSSFRRGCKRQVPEQLKDGSKPKAFSLYQQKS